MRLFLPRLGGVRFGERERIGQCVFTFTKHGLVTRRHWRQTILDGLKVGPDHIDMSLNLLFGEIHVAHGANEFGISLPQLPARYPQARRNTVTVHFHRTFALSPLSSLTPSEALVAFGPLLPRLGVGYHG